jgi:hypothetical protein
MPGEGGGGGSIPTCSDPVGRGRSLWVFLPFICGFVLIVSFGAHTIFNALAFIDLQYRHGREAWTWTRSMDIDTQHGLGHAGCQFYAAWTWTNPVHAAIRPCCMFMSTLHVLAHATCSCPCYMPMSLLHIHVHVHVSILHVHAACPRQCCIFKSMQHGHRNAVWSSQCSMDMDTQRRHGHTA